MKEWQKAHIEQTKSKLDHKNTVESIKKIVFKDLYSYRCEMIKLDKIAGAYSNKESYNYNLNSIYETIEGKVETSYNLTRDFNSLFNYVYYVEYNDRKYSFINLDDEFDKYCEERSNPIYIATLMWITGFIIIGIIAHFS